jgi:hypothetical protein
LKRTLSSATEAETLIFTGDFRSAGIRPKKLWGRSSRPHGCLCTAVSQCFLLVFFFAFFLVAMDLFSLSILHGILQRCFVATD